MDETGPADVPSAFQSLYTCFRIFIVSGRPPRNFESQRRRRSGSMCRWMRPLMVGPKVFSWSEPVRAIRSQHSIPLARRRAPHFPVPIPAGAAADGRGQVGPAMERGRRRVHVPIQIKYLRGWGEDGRAFQSYSSRSRM